MSLDDSLIQLMCAKCEYQDVYIDFFKLDIDPDFFCCPNCGAAGTTELCNVDDIKENSKEDLEQILKGVN